MAAFSQSGLVPADAAVSSSAAVAPAAAVPPAGSIAPTDASIAVAERATAGATGCAVGTGGDIGEVEEEDGLVARMSSTELAAAIAHKRGEIQHARAHFAHLNADLGHLLREAHRRKPQHLQGTADAGAGSGAASAGEGAGSSSSSSGAAGAGGGAAPPPSRCGGLLTLHSSSGSSDVHAAAAARGGLLPLCASLGAGTSSSHAAAAAGVGDMGISLPLPDVVAAASDGNVGSGGGGAAVKRKASSAFSTAGSAGAGSSGSLLQAQAPRPKRAPRELAGLAPALEGAHDFTTTCAACASATCNSICLYKMKAPHTDRGGAAGSEPTRDNLLHLQYSTSAVRRRAAVPDTALIQACHDFSDACPACVAGASESLCGLLRNGSKLVKVVIKTVNRLCLGASPSSGGSSEQ